MKVRISELVKNITTLSKLMKDRTKIETRDIIKYHPNKITINAAEKISTAEDNSFYVYTFEEEPNKFAFSGYMLNKIFDGILAACEGDENAMNEAIKQEKICVKLSTATTKNKNTITMVELVEE